MSSFATLTLNKFKYLFTDVCHVWHDPLTQAYNRGFVMRLLQQEHARFTRYGNVSSIILVDLDDFKPINDRYGHLVGDILLKLLVKRFHSVLRATDIVGRFGGEEFLILLPETEIEDAEVVANRLVTECAEKPFSIKKLIINMTISAGVTQVINGDTIASLLNRADTALYEAKAVGKNIYAIK